ncbi:MAG: ABC transporter ATP-binding protein [Firmicutes bacterium]|nr:ABC transporter ATP-binding protein [Bacillota bacterium]
MSFLKSKPDQDITETIEIDSVVKMVDVSYIYKGPPPLQALYEVSLNIRNGEHVAIIGPSGSGKSTFLNLVGLLDRPTSGEIYIDNIDTKNLKERERSALRARKIGFVFQAFHLLSYKSALENVMLAQLYIKASRAKREKDAMEALQKVGLSKRAHALPSELSGGERQRVAMARAIVNKPSLILCDEPTGNLDSVTADMILDILDDLSKSGLTLLVITHSSQVAARAERSLSFSDGRLVG